MNDANHATGAHGGGIPPGWDTPVAREAAAAGVDLWLLDSSLKRTVFERIEDNFTFVRMADELRKGLVNPGTQQQQGLK